MSKRVSRSLATPCPILASNKELRALSPSEGGMSSGQISVYAHAKNTSATVETPCIRLRSVVSDRSLAPPLLAKASWDTLLFFWGLPQQQLRRSDFCLQLQTSNIVGLTLWDLSWLQRRTGPTEKQKTGEGVLARVHLFINNQAAWALGWQVDFFKIERFL